VSVNPRCKIKHFRPSWTKTHHLSCGRKKWDLPSTKACPAQWPMIDDGVIERLAKGKLPSSRSAWGVDVCPPKAKVTRSNRVGRAICYLFYSAIFTRELKLPALSGSGERAIGRKFVSSAGRSNTLSNARLPNSRAMSRDRNCPRADLSRTHICPERSPKRGRRPSAPHGP